MARRSRIAGHPVVALAGAYPGPRAAALAGVPKSTVYYWARKSVIVPSVSRTKEMLWSYADLIGLRLVHWLRHNKVVDEAIVRATPMREVRRALARLAEAGADVWRPAGTGAARSPLLVDRSGRIHLEGPDDLADLEGQQPLGKAFCRLLAPFHLGELRGPDLVAPRPLLRIVPGKLSGEPHIRESRISTLAIGALARRGLALDVIAGLYPGIAREAVEQAIDLELQLTANEAVAA